MVGEKWPQFKQVSLVAIAMVCLFMALSAANGESFLQIHINIFIFRVYTNPTSGILKNKFRNK